MSSIPPRLRWRAYEFIAVAILVCYGGFGLVWCVWKAIQFVFSKHTH